MPLVTNVLDDVTLLPSSSGSVTASDVYAALRAALAASSEAFTFLIEFDSLHVKREVQ
jgi:hypothetical protein